jgi:hypothetical protein
MTSPTTSADAVKVLREYSQQHGCPDDFELAISALTTPARMDGAIRGASSSRVEAALEVAGAVRKKGGVWTATTKNVQTAIALLAVHKETP